MRIPRIYHQGELSQGQQLELQADAANHVAKVLRMTAPQQLRLFNGDGNDYLAELESVSKKQVTAKILEASSNDSESPLKIHLGQVISRGDRMDITLQKSVELGVTKITPLFSQRCGVKLSGERLEKKQQQWQKIVISACEQSGRSFVPIVEQAVALEQWLQQQTTTEELKLTLDPCAEISLSQIEEQPTKLRLLIGPEGGLTDEEIVQSKTQGFQAITLGPRILRTETAALTVISILQNRFGDL